MEPAISKEAGIAFKARWAAVNAAERAELQRTSGERKLQQLAALMASAGAMGHDPQREVEVATVRARWGRLRRAMLG